MHARKNLIVEKPAAPAAVDVTFGSRRWFVELASLKDFITEQDRQRKIWRAELARKRREEQLLNGHPSEMREEHRAASDEIEGSSDTATSTPGNGGGGSRRCPGYRRRCLAITAR